MSTSTPSPEDLLNVVKNALKERGTARVLIAGKTGVGKSTLINAVFHGDFATTGQGRPVTSSTREYTKEGIPLVILDSRGLELGDTDKQIDDLIKYVEDRKRDNDPNRHIHCAWVCVNEGSGRVEPEESDLCKRLSAHMPVIAVITKARSDNGFERTVRDLLPDVRQVVRVRALAETLDEEIHLAPRGLDTLVEVTIEALPEGQRRAFAAAQKANVDQKVKQSQLIVLGAAGAAGAAGATPIPFADALIIVPTQLGMLAGISATFGLDLTQAFLGTLVSTAVAAIGGTAGGRAVVAGLLKLIPGAGTIAGGIIGGATAAALTGLVGSAYIATLYGLLKGDPDRKLSAEEIGQAFSKRLKRGDKAAITSLEA